MDVVLIMVDCAAIDSNDYGWSGRCGIDEGDNCLVSKSGGIEDGWCVRQDRFGEVVVHVVMDKMGGVLLAVDVMIEMVKIAKRVFNSRIIGGKSLQNEGSTLA